MAGQTSIENGKNGGRPAGRKNDMTLKREAILKAMQQRIMAAADLLLDSQFSLARGQAYLYKIEKYYEKVKDDKGKERKVLRAKPPKLVESETEIRSFIESEVEEFNGNEISEGPDADYYFLTTKQPDNRAIEGMFSRTFGRAVQPVALTDVDGENIIDNESKTKARKAIAGFVKTKAKRAHAGFVGGHPRARRKKGN